MNTKDINARCSCFNFRKASRAVTQFFDHTLEASGIRATQFTLLVSLANVQARTLTEMAGALVMDRTTLTRNLKPLEKLALIEHVESHDKRSKAYVLSAKGRDVLQKSLPLWEKAQQHVLGKLGYERYEALLQELDAVIQLIGEA